MLILHLSLRLIHSVMPPSWFDFHLCKALFHAAGEADFGVLAWPLAILMVLRRYQSFVAYALTASIVAAFFVGMIYITQLHNSVALFTAFAQRLH